jgi:hypothetical protein
MWNHRVLAYDNGELGIHEVFYSKKKKKPKMCTVNAVGVYGNDIEELRETLQRMLKSLDTPILEYDSFEK